MAADQGRADADLRHSRVALPRLEQECYMYFSLADSVRACLSHFLGQPCRFTATGARVLYVFLISGLCPCPCRFTATGARVLYVFLISGLCPCMRFPALSFSITTTSPSDGHGCLYFCLYFYFSILITQCSGYHVKGYGKKSRNTHRTCQNVV